MNACAHGRKCQTGRRTRLDDVAGGDAASRGEAMKKGGGAESHQWIPYRQGVPVLGSASSCWRFEKAEGGQLPRRTPCANVNPAFCRAAVFCRTRASSVRPPASLPGCYLCLGVSLCRSRPSGRYAVSSGQVQVRREIVVFGRWSPAVTQVPCLDRVNMVAVK